MDLFRLLGNGATFNKQRFQNDVEIFEVSHCEDRRCGRPIDLPSLSVVYTGRR